MSKSSGSMNEKKYYFDYYDRFSLFSHGKLVCLFEREGNNTIVVKTENAPCEFPLINYSEEIQHYLECIIRDNFSKSYFLSIIFAVKEIGNININIRKNIALHVWFRNYSNFGVISFNTKNTKFYFDMYSKDIFPLIRETKNIKALRIEGNIAIQQANNIREISKLRNFDVILAGMKFIPIFELKNDKITPYTREEIINSCTNYTFSECKVFKVLLKVYDVDQDLVRNFSDEDSLNLRNSMIKEDCEIEFD